ncbi:hypothetical protein ACFQ3W_04990 [Paenibacillus puldeungensis]|uniref:30S ribosomal protein S4 n=1 Tax=Paenibacillus puldeungensis TaxID=696536 RepID=A0ABW3RTC0_9BACL
MVTELKRYQRRRYRLKHWWVTERLGVGRAERGKRKRYGFNTLNYLDIKWE